MNEDNVIDGVVNYLKEKNRHRDGFRVLHRSHAKDHDKGIDLKCAAYSNGVISNRYYIEGKGTLKVGDDSKKKSDFRTEFRWAISEIILRMKDLSSATVYGIAIPENEKEKCLRLMRNNKGLKLLKVRLYLSYRRRTGSILRKR